MKSALRSGVDGVVLFARLALQVLKEKLSTHRRGGRNVVGVSFNTTRNVLGFQSEAIKKNN
jgi:hypothetical protein